jgi:hypothetical protein
VVEGTTVDVGIVIVALTTEDIGAETVAPLALGTISLITGEIMASETLEAVDAFEPLLLLFPFGFSIFCLGLLLGGGLTISGSNFPFLKSIHYTRIFGNNTQNAEQINYTNFEEI